MSDVVARLPDRSAPLEVYRCGNSHWHYMPHNNDTSSSYIPWYRCIAAVDSDKFEELDTVYVQGSGSEKFIVWNKEKSSFYYLRKSRNEQQWCMGRYGQRDRMMYREEELSLTSWGDEKHPPPAYEESISGQDWNRKDGNGAKA